MVLSSSVIAVVCAVLLFSLARCDLFDYTCFAMSTRENPNFIGMRLPPDTTDGNARVVRHHVIRRVRISQFFNAALHYNADVRREIIEISLDLLDDAHAYFSTDNRLALRIPWERMSENALRIPERGVDFMDWMSEGEEESSLRTLHALWTWMPFNYVIGPGERSDDDVTANVDHPLRHVVGERAFEMLLDLHAAMTRFLYEPARPQGVPESFVQFRNLINGLRRLGVNPAYDPGAWEVTRDPTSGRALTSIDGHVKYHVKKPSDNDDARRSRRGRRDVIELDKFCIQTFARVKQQLSPSSSGGGGGGCRYENYGKVTGSTAGFVAGGIAGQAIIPVPFVGFVLGGILGSALGLGIGAGVETAAGC